MGLTGGRGEAVGADQGPNAAAGVAVAQGSDGAASPDPAMGLIGATGPPDAPGTSDTTSVPPPTPHPHSTSSPGVFEMLKIGVGPSSSHTLGPWLAARRFVDLLSQAGQLSEVAHLQVDLYGSLALTGKGHGTDRALILGLLGADPVTVPLEYVAQGPENVRLSGVLLLGGMVSVPFDAKKDLVFHKDSVLPGHPNGMQFRAQDGRGAVLLESTAYSIGGGFVVFEGDSPNAQPRPVPFDVSTGAKLLSICQAQGLSIADIARQNELASIDEHHLSEGLKTIWQVMEDSVHRGCLSTGQLPGGLEVFRRASDLVRRTTGQEVVADRDRWFSSLRPPEGSMEFSRILTLVGAFALAVSEENAAFGRIVTAPTNGSAGVLPAVLLYYRLFSGRSVGPRELENFLLVAALIGGIFKTGATISAAMGGCQAEIGVSSAMAAAALTEGLGGNPEQTVMAAEIAMEHHLGLTCDPIGGLVQIPCIERNTMGAVKAITAAYLALQSETARAKVSLDAVVKTLWDTAMDMNTRYKETSLGGLAVNVAVNIPEC